MKMTGPLRVKIFETYFGEEKLLNICGGGGDGARYWRAFWYFGRR
jgi:hypothetical protein